MTKSKVIPAGTGLYHGTNCAGFMVPDGPAWFAWTPTIAEKWAGWASPPPGRATGPKRVIELIALRDINLVDTISREDWEQLGLQVLDDPDPLIHDIAQAVAIAGLTGWFGRTEVMLTNPGQFLEPLREYLCATQTT